MQKPEKQCVHVAEQHFMIKISTCSIMSNSCIQITRSPSHFLKKLKIWYNPWKINFSRFYYLFHYQYSCIFHRWCYKRLLQSTWICASNDVDKQLFCASCIAVCGQPDRQGITGRSNDVGISICQGSGFILKDVIWNGFFLAFSEIFILVIMYFII